MHSALQAKHSTQWATVPHNDCACTAAVISVRVVLVSARSAITFKSIPDTVEQFSQTLGVIISDLKNSSRHKVPGSNEGRVMGWGETRDTLSGSWPWESFSAAVGKVEAF